MSKLAIVIPYYKITFFEECLESLKNQTNKNFTVYVGDDFSPENPILLIQKYSDFINIKYTRFESNLGGRFLTKQWDRCVDLIENEEWIMLLGDDDYLDTNFVEEYYNIFPLIKKEKITLLRGNVLEINEVNDVLRRFYFPKKELPSNAYIKKLKENYHISLPEYIFKKKEYIKFKFQHFPYAFGSDNIAWLEFSNNNYIYTIDSFVNIRSSSLSITGNNSNIEEKVYAMYLTKKYILKKLNRLFSKNELNYIAFKAYKDLCYSNKNNFFEKITFVIYCKIKYNINVRENYKLD